MFENKRILAIIPARGGSKGIKHKNIINLAGKPMIAYSIVAAKESNYIDDIVVSTDDEQIKEKALEYGAEVPFMRPDYLASDTAKTIDTVIHAISFLKEKGRIYDSVVLLQPTQPLRTAEDIDAAIELFYKNEGKSLVSVTKVDNHPLLIRTIDGSGELSNLLKQNSTLRRQDMPDFYCVNGCIYINKVDEIDENTSFNDNKIPYIMDKERSVDIDEMGDLKLAEFYLR